MNRLCLLHLIAGAARAQDLTPKAPPQKASVAVLNAMIQAVYHEEPLDLEEAFKRYAAIGERLAPHVADTGAAVREAWREGRSILFEGDPPNHHSWKKETTVCRTRPTA